MAHQTGDGEPYGFLSYTTADRARVLALADRLDAVGIRVWVDRRDLVGGSSWNASIVDAIAHCSVFILTCSPASIASPNVQQEVQLAWEEQRPILPVLLERMTIPRELRYPLAGRQWVELLDRAEDSWLPDVLRALSALGMSPASLPPVALADPAEPVVVQLPTPLTSFIGRERELRELTALLETNRLLTLSGPGGTGKTRLAIAIAARVAERYPEGVWFVYLAGIADAAGVIPAIAGVLGVRESEGSSLSMSLAAFLRRKRTFLVLDNVEQVVGAAMSLYDLLAETPGLSLLLTSRILLRVEGEREYAVPPLPLPEAGVAAVPEQLGTSPAVQLFVERAQALRAGFSLSNENAAAVAAICQRLDGLPLAIELAAARVKLLSPAQILARLDQRLAFLTGGERNRPERQQTLRATVAWSWDLLSEPEQRLFRRLAVFVGGFTLDAAEAVCNADEALDVLEGLAALADQSLVRRYDDPSGEPRFGMLATLQEFALEKLEASGEATNLRHKHAAYCCTLAETAQTGFWQRGRYAALQPLFVERDNLLAALQWLLKEGEGESGLRLCAALQQYWYFKEPGEGLRWSETFLTEASGDVTPEPRGGAHWAAGAGAWAVGKFGDALEHFERASALLRGTAAQIELVLALSSAAMLRMPTDAAGARGELEEARLAARATGSEHLIGTVAMNAAYALMTAQLPAEALPLAEEALRIGRGLGAEWQTAITLTNLGNLAQLRGEMQAAYGCFREAATLFELMQDRWGIAGALTGIATCEAAAGETGALGNWQASLAIHAELANRTGIVTAVLGVAALLAAGGRSTEAARLLGAVEDDVEEVNAGPHRHWAQPAHDQALVRSRAGLRPEAFARAWAEGRALSLEQVADLALAVTPPPFADTNAVVPPILGAAAAAPRDVNSDHAG